MAEKFEIAGVLRTLRQSKGLSQESFSNVACRTYISALERGMKNPTVQKLNEICDVLDIHPMTLFTLAYAGTNHQEIQAVFTRVLSEIDTLRAEA
ncbi:helix-turn-helix transcriptional regulator [Pectobacterium brasiliense]